LPLGSLAFGRLEDKIQEELDINPFLKKQGIKLRVVDATAGYITVEMYDGNRDLRERIVAGVDIMTGQVESAQFWSGTSTAERESVNILRRTLGYVGKMDGVKQVLLTAITGNPMPFKPHPGSEWVEAKTGIKFVWVKGGCFDMGTSTSERTGLLKEVNRSIGQENFENAKGHFVGWLDRENPRHRVCVDGFWLGKYEVTQGQWQTLMKNNPSFNKKGNDFPVEYVSWDDCQKFIDKLISTTGRKFRLPTEAQWEYAARGGKVGEKYSGFDDSAITVHIASSSTHPVGHYADRTNTFGLYDMTGNVWEWCADWFDEGYYKKSPVQNPLGPGKGSVRVLRGGGWSNAAFEWIEPHKVSWLCDLQFFARTSVRVGSKPSYHNLNLGFRLLSPGRHH